ncbi:MAG TPA: TonB-dependent receptor [Gammaproteobacteria bacterium]|nr:TonB-dependent receptor [Gammaproteobacteria bacterium]
MNEHPVVPRDKALKVNLDPRHYGTFAEIGAGQEVVRWFFRAGGAAGTIAKSISAYDMKVSDAIYGSCTRYVCRERLQSMLDYEQRLNLERLGGIRGEDTTFFAFADTVSARSFRGNNECHGWMGIKFQATPGGDNNQIVIHVRMLDNENALQQEALGIVGLNLVYGACFFHDQPERLLESLLDGLSTNRIEIDLIEFSGDEFGHVDNRVMSLRLVQLGLTGAAMFSSEGKVLQPSEVLYKKPVLVERGRFRPVTYVNLDLAAAALKSFEAESDDVAPGETVSIMEITMRNLMAQGDVDLNDFISRADVLATTGHTVMISDFIEYYRLAAYLFRYTNRRIGLAMGAMNLREIFDESYYLKLEGGILESFGRLFKNNLKLFVYPYLDQVTNELITIDNVEVAPSLRQLYGYLVDRRCIVQLTDINPAYLRIYSPDVLRKISAKNPEWESVVPPKVAEAIKSRGLFGYQ